MSRLLKPIPFKPPRLAGFSEQLLARHYEEHYGSLIRELAGGEAGVLHDQSRLSLCNAALLHEVYFDCLGGQDGLGGTPAEPDGALCMAIRSKFGSVTAWTDSWRQAAKAQSGGWLVLAWSAHNSDLVAYQTEDDSTALAGCVPVMALDLAPHAFEPDFASIDSYIDAFFENLHWDRPNARWGAAHQGKAQQSLAPAGPGRLSVEQLTAELAGSKPPVILDICLDDDRPKRHDQLPGAQMFSPDELTENLKALASDQPYVVYCMYGYQVSANAVSLLRSHGFDARQLLGGIAAWHAIGGPTRDLT